MTLRDAASAPSMSRAISTMRSTVASELGVELAEVVERPAGGRARRGPTGCGFDRSASARSTARAAAPSPSSRRRPTSRAPAGCPARSGANGDVLGRTGLARTPRASRRSAGRSASPSTAPTKRGTSMSCMNGATPAISTGRVDGGLASAIAASRRPQFAAVLRHRHAATRSRSPRRGSGSDRTAPRFSPRSDRRRRASTSNSSMPRVSTSAPRPVRAASLRARCPANDRSYEATPTPCDDRRAEDEHAIGVGSRSRARSASRTASPARRRDGRRARTERVRDRAEQPRVRRSSTRVNPLIRVWGPRVVGPRVLTYTLRLSVPHLRGHGASRALGVSRRAWRARRRATRASRRAAA